MDSCTYSFQFENHVVFYPQCPVVTSGTPKPHEFDFIICYHHHHHYHYSTSFSGSIALYYSDDLNKPYKTPSVKPIEDPVGHLTGMAMGKCSNSGSELGFF